MVREQLEGLFSLTTITHLRRSTLLLQKFLAKSYLNKHVFKAIKECDIISNLFVDIVYFGSLSIISVNPCIIGLKTKV